MKNNLLTRSLVGLAVVGTLAVTVLGATNASATSAPVTHGACVEHGKPNSVLGNWMLYDWNNSKCPPNTYPASLGGTVALPAPAKHVTKDLGAVSSVPTGGSFFANSTEVGTVDLQPGTYLVTVSAKATPNVNSSTPVFPQFFVYNQAKNAAFDGDLFNVGSGALATGSTTIDSYYSGVGTVTVTTATTLHVLAFGYSPDKSAGSYQLDDLTVTAVPVP